MEIAVYSSEDRCIGEISLLSFIFLMIEARNQSQQHPRIIPCTHIFKVKKNRVAYGNRNVQANHSVAVKTNLEDFLHVKSLPIIML